MSAAGRGRVYRSHTKAMAFRTSCLAMSQADFSARKFARSPQGAIGTSVLRRYRDRAMSSIAWRRPHGVYGNRNRFGTRFFRRSTWAMTRTRRAPSAARSPARFTEKMEFQPNGCRGWLWQVRFAPSPIDWRNQRTRPESPSRIPNNPHKPQKERTSSRHILAIFAPS